jgi:hypothetical protein
MKIKIKYEIEDGYAGGSRPFYCSVDTFDFNVEMTEGKVDAESIENDLRDVLHEHYMERISVILPASQLEALVSAIQKEVDEE